MLLWIVIPQFLSQVIIFHILVMLFETQVSYVNLQDMNETFHDQHFTVENVDELTDNKTKYNIFEGLLITFSILNLLPLFLIIHSRLGHYQYHIGKNMSHAELFRNKGIWLDVFYIIDQIVISSI